MTTLETAAPMVRITALDKHFGPLHVLRAVSLQVPAGQRYVICGPSGCGKSTLLRCVNRLEPFQSGEIVVNGQSLPVSSAGLFQAPAEVGMVFQSFNLFPHMSVLENCTLAPMKLRGATKAEAQETAMHFLERVRLADHIRKFPGQLSGGQQQRVAIARALCMKPKVMLLDEPTSALDPEMVKEVLDILELLAVDGMTMIMVTHEMGFARRVADKIVFMEKGQILEVSSPDVFFSEQANPRSRLFVSQVLH